MTTEDAFVRAISDAPEDELNWLAYADWLEEQGDLLGELIRLRIQLDKLGPTDPTRPTLEQRHAILESATGLTEWANRLAGSGFAVRRCRGFIAEFCLDLCRWAIPFGAGRHLLGTSRTQQIFESLRSFLSVPRRFMALPTKLDVQGDKDYGSERQFRIPPDVAAELLALPCFQNLHSLAIGNGTVILEAETVGVVVTHPNLERLRTLELSGHRIGVEGALALGLRAG